MTASSPIDTLKQAIREFAARNPSSVVTFNKGSRIIEEGTESSDFFLVQSGYLSVLVKNTTDLSEREVALRFEGDLVGESTILQRHGHRNASVVVISARATLVQLSRHDILGLFKGDTTVTEALIAVWEMAAARRAETLQVLGNEVRVENKVMTALIADIHNFSLLGEFVSEELSNCFLFEFMEELEDICRALGGLFEDQGDGFKSVFEGLNHVGRAVRSAAMIRQKFLSVRLKWAEQSSSFHDAGLGIGVCTDCMSI